MKIRIAHSPDSDDYFLFWALRERRLDWGPFDFEFETYDTATLNSLSRDGISDIVAISAAAFPAAAQHYLILSSGASVGRGYGPQLVSTEAKTIDQLRHGTVGVPGKSTTAGFVLRQLLPDVALVEIPIAPFERVFRVLSSGEVDAAVLIHEGQMNIEEAGLTSIADLGVFWQQTTGLPLPLGLNCVRAALGAEICCQLNTLAEQSVKMARAHLSEVIPYLQTVNTARGASVTSAEGILRYLNYYANRDSEHLAADVIEGLRLLLASKDFMLLDKYFAQT